MAQDSLQKQIGNIRRVSRQDARRPVGANTAFVCAVAWIFPGRSPAPEDLGIVSIPAVAHVPWAAA